MGIFEEAYNNVLTEMDIKKTFLFCSLNSGLSNSVYLLENNGIKDAELSEKVRQMIDSDKFWVVNDYEGFANSLGNNDKKMFLTPYTAQEFKNGNMKTFQLKGFEIGFALHKDEEDGEVDIISVHNNETRIGGVVDNLMNAAKRFGGTKLDHFEGKLSDFYSRNGFEEYDRLTWDDQYAPKDWDYKKYGRPDVVLRKLKREQP